MARLRGQDRVPGAEARLRRLLDRMNTNPDWIDDSGAIQLSDGVLALVLATDPGLTITSDGLKALVQDVLSIDSNGIKLNFGDGLASSSSSLVVDLADTEPGLQFVSGDLKLLLGTTPGLELDSGLKALVQGVLAIDASGIKLNFGNGLTNNAGTLEADASAIDHGSLAGLADDDHTQYHNDSRALTWLGTRSTDDLPEGSNLYFTDERAQDAVGTILTDSASIDFTYDDAGNSITAVVIDGSIGLAKLGALTTKGDLLGHSGTDHVRVPVGNDDQMLVADSSVSSGVSWTDAGAFVEPGTAEGQLAWWDNVAGEWVPVAAGDEGVYYRSDGATAYLGIGESFPERQIHVVTPNASPPRVEFTRTGEGAMRFSIGNNGALLLDVLPDSGSAVAQMTFFRFTNTTGAKRVQFHKGDGTNDPQMQFGTDGTDSYINTGANFGLGNDDPEQPLHLTAAGPGFAGMIGLENAGDGERWWIGAGSNLFAIQPRDASWNSAGLGFIADRDGNHGLGIIPSRPCHINGVMRLEPRSTAPSSPSLGDLYVDSTDSKLKFYDGTAWVDLN